MIELSNIITTLISTKASWFDKTKHRSNQNDRTSVVNTKYKSPKPIINRKYGFVINQICLHKSSIKNNYNVKISVNKQINQTQ